MNKQKPNVTIESDKKLLVADADANIIEITDEAAKAVGRSRERLVGRNIRNILSKNVIYDVCFDDLISGRVRSYSCPIEMKDGSKAFVTIESFPVHLDGEQYVRLELLNVAQPDNYSEKEPVDAVDVDGLNSNELMEIMTNVRVKTPTGEIPLNKLLFDILVGHSEIKQYKDGSLTMIEALEDRMRQEEYMDNNEEISAVLERVKEEAESLHSRIN